MACSIDRSLFANATLAHRSPTVENSAITSARIISASATISPVCRLKQTLESTPRAHTQAPLKSSKPYLSFVVRAASDSGSSADDDEDATVDEVINVGVSDVEEEEVEFPIEDPPKFETSPSEADELKQALVDSLYGTERGLRASSETRGEITEIVAQLEAINPTPTPTEAASLLDGKWILAYTSFSELFPLLAAGKLPLVEVGEISQTVESLSNTVKNAVTFSGPIASTTFTTNASFEIRSSKRLQVKFEEGILGTPQFSESFNLPGYLDIAGQKIDLASFQGVIRPLEEAAAAIARLISGQPPLKFPFNSSQAQSWLLTTYLDEDLRISRGDGGSLFVLIKEGSPLKV